jgi:hypothetical protein
MERNDKVTLDQISGCLTQAALNYPRLIASA